MRIALDSSVLAAAHISRAGVCAELLEDLLLHHELVTSEDILEELRRALMEKFRFPTRDTDQIRAFLRRAALIVEPADVSSGVCRDPGNIPVLGTPVSSVCALLISVDRDLLEIRRFKETSIILPGEYWRSTDQVE